MLLVFLGLLCVIVITPPPIHKEVERASVLYHSQLQVPYQMPPALHTSHKHFTLIRDPQGKPERPSARAIPLPLHRLQEEREPPRPPALPSQ